MAGSITQVLRKSSFTQRVNRQHMARLEAATGEPTASANVQPFLESTHKIGPIRFTRLFSKSNTQVYFIVSFSTITKFYYCFTYCILKVHSNLWYCSL